MLCGLDGPSVGTDWQTAADDDRTYEGVAGRPELLAEDTFGAQTLFFKTFGT